MTQLTLSYSSARHFFGWVKFCPKNKSQPNCHSVDTSDAAVIASNNAISELKKDNI
jgi:hypothetical protein